MIKSTFLRWVLYFCVIMLIFIGVSSAVKVDLPQAVIYLAMIGGVFAVSLEEELRSVK